MLRSFMVSVLDNSTPSVSVTHQVFNIIVVPSGVYRYFKESRMFWPLAKAIIIGTLPGVFRGAWVRVSSFPGCNLIGVVLDGHQYIWFLSSFSAGKTDPGQFTVRNARACGKIDDFSRRHRDIAFSSLNCSLHYLVAKTYSYVSF